MTLEAVKKVVVSSQEIADKAETLSKMGENANYLANSVQKIIALCFEKLGLEEMHSYCALNNPASARILEKLGMTELENISNDRIFNGQNITSQHFVITKTKWQEIQK